MTRDRSPSLHVHRIATLLSLALAVLAARCPVEQPILRILAPEDGATVEGCSVELQIHTKGTADPATLSAELNGVPIPLERAAPGATLWIARVDSAPDSPLSTQNLLRVSVSDGAGTTRTEQVGFDFAATEPRARRIVDPSDLPSGPQANGRIGDWLLENCRARFVIQDAPQRDLTGIGQYGGNLIDMELRDHPGAESFMEIQPMLHIETVVNAEVVEIVNDGLNGQPAIVRSCGPDDPIDYINANTLVDDLLGPGSFPPIADDADLPIEACTTYSLAAGEKRIEMTTTVENLGGSELGLYVGDYLNGSGELEQWTSERDDENPTGLVSGIGEMSVNTGFGAFSYFGFGDAEGVDYAYVPLAFPGGGTSSSFTQTGVSAILHSNAIVTVLFFQFPPLFSVPAGAARSFTRFISVGDGSGANAVELEQDLRGLLTGTLRGRVTVGGEPVAGARVAAGVLGSAAGLEDLRSHWVTDEQGYYEGRLPAPATYDVAAARKGVPYEGGGSTPIYHPVELAPGETVELDIALPPTGRVEVNVVDEAGSPLPARVSVVGSDPSPEIVSTFNLSALEIETATFHDATKDPIPDGLVWVAYSDAAGRAAFDLEPGSYEIWVSRGSEYSAYRETVNVAPAPAEPLRIDAQIARVVDTSGFVSSDFHVHMLPSSDSSIAQHKRVLQFAGEGVDNLVATDHDRHTDLRPVIASLSLSDWLHSTIGEEITTFDYGHYNAYPLGIDPDRITGGSTDWAGPAAIGRGFPSSSPPAYTLLPGEIFEEVHATERVAGGLLNESPELAVQINHIDSHFAPLKIDTGDAPIRSHLSKAEKLARRFSPDTPDTDFFHVFDALEVWNGYTRGHQSEFLDDRIGIWMNHLNQGIPITAIFDTDTHGFFNTRAGGARSWTPASHDAPAQVDDDEVAAAVRAGKVVGGQGVYVQARLVATNAPANVGDFSLNGSTRLDADDAQVTLEVDVQAPVWAEYDTIEIYRNAQTVVTGRNAGVPVLYSATPSETLLLSEGDFVREVQNVHPDVPGASRFETSLALPYSLSQDTWFVVVVRGSDTGSASMFPVMAASQGSGGVRALGSTNALYANVDGNDVFDAPGLSVTSP